MCEIQKNIRAQDKKALYYIIGPMNLQNELIASYLKQKTGNEGLVVDDNSQIRTDDAKDQSHQKLLFWDCQGKSLNGLLTELSHYLNGSRSENHIVLFNVPSDLEFEKKYVLKSVRGFFYEHESLDI